ncbi:hypothetical protein V144x_14590 [Gimesia aquarii]|uniref:Uncharacterized protein n=1 Tax=Gimesia aquarii TaxID=2527964 RepID=A0A517VSM4_9PLAN|nr:hypothetical protein V144x_14590 [Gimesia aquarii]
MLWERTLLNNFVGEPDAPVKSAEAYLSIFIFQMLYAMVSLSLMIRMSLRTIILRIETMGVRSEIVSKTSRRFCCFLQLFLCSIAIGIE